MKLILAVVFVLFAGLAYAAAPEQYHSAACDDLPSMRQRAECRINLDKEYSPIPELCRSIGGGKEGDACVQQHAMLSSCLDRVKSTVLQLECARSRLGISIDSVDEALVACRAEENSAFCIEKVKYSAISFTQFKFDILLSRIEQLYRAGAVKESVAVSYIVQIEELKHDFYAAQTIGGKRAVVQRTIDSWNAFLVLGGLQ